MEDRIHFLNTRQDMREYAKAYEYIIVKFTAPWCQPCKNINPLFKELFLKLPEKFICVVVNIDNGKDLSNALRIRSVPTFLKPVAVCINNFQPPVSAFVTLTCFPIAKSSWSSSYSNVTCLSIGVLSLWIIS